jgi:perosamine synthetase
MFRKDYLPFGKPNFSDQEVSAISEVLHSGWIGMGSQTIAFEEELADYMGAKYVVTVSSCTAALFLALLVQGVKAGDEVICPSLTWCSTANAALYLGATPVFCDIDPETYCITPELIQQKLTPKTKAVIVVHLGGLAQDMEKIRAILPDGVAVIEDAAHALGAHYPNGNPVGSSGNLTCFSFYANKNLSTGEGGAIALFDEELADRLKSLRQHGMPINAWKRFTYPKVMIQAELTELGYKMNYTDLQACLGRVQLKRQSEFYQTRLETAQYYYEHLKISHPTLKFQHHVLSSYHARHLFLIQLPNFFLRDNLLLELRARNIGASIHYPPLHKMPLYATNNNVSLPCTEIICSHILTLPISAKMTMADASYVVEQLQDLLK